MKGFLPEKQPSKTYSISNNSLDLLTNVANDLPKLLLTGQLQKQINHLKKNDFEISRKSRCWYLKEEATKIRKQVRCSIRMHSSYQQ